MKIGYPCINLSVDCKGNKTFRIRSYSEERMIETIENNLDCLLRMLKYNKEKGLLYFRISSDLIPFASHPICNFEWQEQFKMSFRVIGDFIKKYQMRVTMHPDQFTLINSIDDKIFERSIKELEYHAQVLDLMGLDKTAKIQIHIGGVYKNKQNSIRRFESRFKKLSELIRTRLVIENDDKSYTLKDCLKISLNNNIPVLFDSFHHEINNLDESIKEAFELFVDTWSKAIDGVPLIDYSSQQEGESKGRHTETINIEHFEKFLIETKPFDFDIMLEIKDKELSALKAIKVASKLRSDCFLNVKQ
jgi:UV DNA damage endonuclease